MNDARPEARNLLLDGFVAQASRAPQTVAIRADGAEVTYAGLLAATARYAAALDARDIGCDDIVAFDAPRTADTIALVLAIVAMGAAYLPLTPTQSDARLAAMIAAARPRLLIGDAQLRARMAQAGPWIDRADLAATQNMLPARRSGALAYVLFTSGSTGMPKGVAMRTAAVAALLEWHLRHARLGHAARTLQFAPLGFDVSFQEIFPTLAGGGTLVLPSDAERRDPWALLALLARERVERVFVPVVVLQALAEAAASAADPTLPALTDVITAGEQLRITPAVRAFFAAHRGCVLHNHYGPTETHVVTAHELRGDASAWPELPPIGTPLPHVLVRIEEPAEPEPGTAADATGTSARSEHASGASAGEGVNSVAAAESPRLRAPDPASPTRDARAPSEGELLLGGDCLAAGYAGQPELTARRFVEREGRRWYRTGDLVRRGADDELLFAGRLDDQLKIAGHRIEPAEIEAALSRHPEIAQAAVSVVAGVAGKRLVAHVVARDPAGPEAALFRQLESHCAVALPEYLRPQAYVLHALLPTTASGKIDRRALARSDADAEIEWSASASLEKNLRRLWERLLGVSRLDVRRNLFDAGARSLTVVQALTELRRRGHVLSVAQVYDHPTIAAQAGLLGGLRRLAARLDANAQGERQRDALARLAARNAGP